MLWAVVYISIIAAGLGACGLAGHYIDGRLQRIMIVIAAFAVTGLSLSIAASFHSWRSYDRSEEDVYKYYTYHMFGDSIDFSSSDFSDEKLSVSIDGQFDLSMRRQGRWRTSLAYRDPLRFDEVVKYYYEDKEITAAEWSQLSGENLEKIESRLGWILATTIAIFWTIIYLNLPVATRRNPITSTDVIQVQNLPPSTATVRNSRTSKTGPNPEENSKTSPATNRNQPPPFVPKPHS